MEKIFDNYGIEIFKEGEKFMLRYDAGELVYQLSEIEISKSDAEKAQKNEASAYKVILKYQNLRMPGGNGGI